MSSFLRFGGGGLNLASRPMISAGPSFPLTFLSLSPQSSQTRRKYSWPEWIALNPTSREEIQTVFKVCDESRMLGSASKRPITPEQPHRRTKPTAQNIYKTFLKTPGLQREDWWAHGLKFEHAVEIALRLHQEHLFTADPLTLKRKLTPTLKSWDQLWDQARRNFEGGPEAFDALRARVLAGDTSTIAALRAEKHEDSLARREDVRVRRVERVRKRAERDADVDGTRSVRRPMGKIHVRQEEVVKATEEDFSKRFGAMTEGEERPESRDQVSKRRGPRGAAAKEKAAKKIAAKRRSRDQKLQREAKKDAAKTKVTLTHSVETER